MESYSQIGRWSIRFDRSVTKQLYADTPVPTCECADCTNFRAAGERAFSPHFLRLLIELGIDPSKPAELSHYGTSGESTPTHGWFHFVGQLVDGTDAWRKTGDATYFLEGEPFPGMTSIGFTSRLSQLPAPFEGHPVVQLEFESVVPWVTAAPLA